MLLQRPSHPTALTRTQRPTAVRLSPRCRASPDVKREEQKLSLLLSWLSQNGAKGFDPDSRDTKVGVFVEGPGNRGLIATKDVRAGQVLFQVPVKLGIIDDAETDELPWSVRLAAKLLRLKAESGACLWYDYVNVLPERVFNATSPDFTYEQVRAVSDVTAREEIDFSRWIASSNFKRLTDDDDDRFRAMLPEGTTEEAFCDAMTVVHSRTFSIPARDRPSGLARLLMPGIDLLNHAGDVDLNMCDAYRSGDHVLATDACRWDLVPKIGGEFLMIVSAVRDIVRGEEVTLSYGERSNDDFFVHYGFVPPRNPHDTVQLHDSLKSAVAWSIERVHALGTAAPNDGLVELYETLCATHTEDSNVDTSGMEFVDSERTDKLKRRVNLQSNGRCDERLALVLEKIHAYVSKFDSSMGTKEEFIRDHVSQRAFEVLAGMSGCDFLADLDTLVAAMPDDDLHDFATMRRTYSDRIVSSPWYEKLRHTRNGRSADDFASDTSTDLMTVQFRAYKSLILWDCLLLNP